MAYNDYLHFTSKAGLPLIAIVVWMIIALYRKCHSLHSVRRPCRRPITCSQQDKLRASLMYIIFALLSAPCAMHYALCVIVHSISDFNLHIPSNAILFTVLGALVVAPVPIEN